jgi:hypothetical protein
MSLKDDECAQVAQLAIDGWLAYIAETTRELSPTTPVDDRMALALAGRELPRWLEEELRIRLVAARGQALAARAVALDRRRV